MMPWVRGNAVVFVQHLADRCGWWRGRVGGVCVHIMHRHLLLSFMHCSCVCHIALTLSLFLSLFVPRTASCVMPMLLTVDALHLGHISLLARRCMQSDHFDRAVPCDLLLGSPQSRCQLL